MTIRHDFQVTEKDSLMSLIVMADRKYLFDG